ncbi:MAG TPA: hypothetical protein VNO86_02555, partial [Candidatus Binatia bacterium]|nr:hypothetical protein [Candidatus Binatia bacterium]
PARRSHSTPPPPPEPPDPSWDGAADGGPGEALPVTAATPSVGGAEPDPLPGTTGGGLAAADPPGAGAALGGLAGAAVERTVDDGVGEGVARAVGEAVGRAVGVGVGGGVVEAAPMVMVKNSGSLVSSPPLKVPLVSWATTDTLAEPLAPGAGVKASLPGERTLVKGEERAILKAGPAEKSSGRSVVTIHSARVPPSFGPKLET